MPDSKKQKKHPPSDPYNFSLLNTISNHLTSSLNTKEAFEKIFEVLEQTIQIEKGVICFQQKNNQDLSIEMAYGFSNEDTDSDNIFIWKKYCEYIATQQIEVIIEDLSKERNIFQEYYTNLSAQSFIGTPIKMGQEQFGVIAIKSRKETRSECEKKLETLKFFGLLISQELKIKSLLQNERSAILTENIQLRSELKEKYNIDNMIGKSNSMLTVFEQISQVANSNVTVLIRGASGTGKELVAHAIHYNSPRNNQPFIKINCGAIPENLIESELFGHEKGAFTDAHTHKIGKFEAAEGGTLLLDEIGELSRPMQVKLLRVLQEREIERVGSNITIPINVRILTATNRDLETDLKNNQFREDLYYRLNVFPIYIPELKDRKSDILLLLEHFIEKHTQEPQKTISGLSNLAIDLLLKHNWPGNVRELENCMERACLVCNTNVIQANDLPPSLHHISPIETNDSTPSLQDQITKYEREIIIETLIKSKGNQRKAAEILQTTERILGYKIKNLNINIQEYKYRSN